MAPCSLQKKASARKNVARVTALVKSLKQEFLQTMRHLAKQIAAAKTASAFFHESLLACRQMSRPQSSLLRMQKKAEFATEEFVVKYRMLYEELVQAKYEQAECQTIA